MKHTTYILLSLLFLIPLFTKAQIENVIVEKYYVSDTNDETDTTGGAILEQGSTTYRVYVDLKPGYKIKRIYGDTHHKLRIESTSNFYNNLDRPTAYFGYLINKSWFPDNPLLALDSWISIGRATKTNSGILKTEDTDGSFIGGTNNYGGSAGIAAGLLNNYGGDAGIALTAADGFAIDNTVVSQWSDFGFRDMAGDDTTVFGTMNAGSMYMNDSIVYLQQNDGVAGAEPDSNKVLVAQLTTKGEISFELNIEVIDSNGGTPIKFVAPNGIVLPDEVVCPFLKYPPLCGCKDPKYLEYNAGYACAINDSCKTLIVCGCTDTVACNYNADANFNIPELCCYPGYCNNRDLAVVCPELELGRSIKIDFIISPNPATDNLSLRLTSKEIKETKYAIYNSFGFLMTDKNIGGIRGNYTEDIDVSKLNKGLYLFRIWSGDEIVTEKFIKN